MVSMESATTLRRWRRSCSSFRLFYCGSQPFSLVQPWHGEYCVGREKLCLCASQQVHDGTEPCQCLYQGHHRSSNSSVLTALRELAPSTGPPSRGRGRPPHTSTFSLQVRAPRPFSP